MLLVKNISFKYKTHLVLNNLSFSVKQGEHFAIIGESGSGKSTLLKLLYGTYNLSQGEIFWKDQNIFGPSHNLIVGSDFMKYVAQEFDLMPFTTVSENIGTFLSNFYPEEKLKRTLELLEVIEMLPYAQIKVKELSGGQKQRVAIARAIAKQPEIILLDEPFSHIDNFTKQSLRRKLFAFLKKQNITCIVATHDKEDVLPYSDNMIVLHDAKILAKGSPIQLYKNPKNKLVASFFNEFNIIEGYGIVYANQIKITTKSQLKATVNRAYFKGNYYVIEAKINETIIFFENNEFLKPGLTVYLEVIR